jgi:hypothetical protein
MKQVFNGGTKGPDTMYIVELWDGNSLIETRELPGKSIHYAESLAKNWEEGNGEFKYDK